MGLPSIITTFQTLASTAIQRTSKGTVGIIIQDTAHNGAHVLTREMQILTDLKTLGAENQKYLERAFLGYVSRPQRIIVYVLPTDAEDVAEALAYFASQRIDYIAGPPDTDTAIANEIKTWIKFQREDGFIPKAVLPQTAANSEAIINFTSEGILVGEVVYTPAEYCARIAGLIAGTPVTSSCTFAPLPEVSNVETLTSDEMDTAINNGEFIIFHDSIKVKVGRGVNSYTNTPKDPLKGDAFKKIKIVEVMDMIQSDIKITAQDTYIGKFANSYDNKCLLIAAIADYFAMLERESILAAGKSSIGIDVEAQAEYLRNQGIDISDMTEQEIKEANTGSYVFLLASISILDAIEDIRLKIRI